MKPVEECTIKKKHMDKVEVVSLAQVDFATRVPQVADYIKKYY